MNILNVFHVCVCVCVCERACVHVCVFEMYVYIREDFKQFPFRDNPVFINFQKVQNPV